MKIKKFNILVSFLTILFFTLPVSVGSPPIQAVSANDCKCPKVLTTTEAFNQNSLVFLGQVISVEKASAIRPNYNIVKMILTKSYKGEDLLPKTDYVVIYTPDKEKECGVQFARQSDYIVFANGNPAFMKTNSCSLTGIQETKKAEQAKLDELAAKK